MQAYLFFTLLHPIGFGEAGDSLKGSAEGAVTLVTAPFCQSKHGDGTVSLSCFTIEADEVVNAQPVDVVVIGRSLFCEIATQIVAVRLDGIGQLHQRQVVFQVQLFAFATLFQHGTDIISDSHRQSARVCLGYRTFERLQCFHAPKQESDDDERIDLSDIFHQHAAIVHIVSNEHKQDAGDGHKTQPNLLALQVGIVVKEPSSVLSHSTNVIDDEDDSQGEEIARRMAADTLNDDYAVILRSRAIAAHAKNHYVEAYDYQTRYADLSKVLSDSLMKGKAHEYAARYHDQEQKLEIAQINAESQRKTIIIWAAVIIILLVSIFATWLLRQWRVIRRKNLVLVEQIGEAIEYKEKYEAVADDGKKSSDTKREKAVPVTPAIESDLLSLDDISDDELFRRLRHAIKREHLYLDPSLDRQKIMDIFQLSRHRVGAAFAQGSEFASLSDFIRDCRLEYSCNLLVTRPDLSIKEVAAKSGFNYASNYSSDFKNRYTMTPSNYRELKSKR